MNKSKTPREQEFKALEELTELKEKLFKATYLNRVLCSEEEYEAPQKLRDIYMTKHDYLQRFIALYSLIEAAGLEDEYQIWKETVRRGG